MRPFLLLIAGWLLWTAAVPDSRAQSDSEAEPVRVIRLHGPRALEVGDVGNYRARVSDASTRPIGFLWDFGDGIASEGTVVAHRYREAGSYTVMVVAYNAGGKDTMRTTVTVREPVEPPAPVTQPSARRTPSRSSPSSASSATMAPSARSPEPSTPEPSSRIARDSVRGKLFSHDPIQPATSGYTWVMASDLWKERIESLLLKYRLQGLRVELMTDVNGSGAKVYRIIAGHFDTVGEALIARALLDPTRVRMHLHGFAPGGMARAVSSLPQALDRLDPQFAGWLDRLPQRGTPDASTSEAPLYAASDDAASDDAASEGAASEDAPSADSAPSVGDGPEATRSADEDDPARRAEPAPPGVSPPTASWFSGSWGWLGAFLAGVIAALSTGAILAVVMSGRLKRWISLASSGLTSEAPAERPSVDRRARATTAQATAAEPAPDTDEIPVMATASRDAEQAGPADLSSPPVLDAREKEPDAGPIGFVDAWVKSQASPLGDGFSSSEPPSGDFSDAEAATDFEAWAPAPTPEATSDDDWDDETRSLEAPSESGADDARPDKESADEPIAATSPADIIAGFEEDADAAARAGSRGTGSRDVEPPNTEAESTERKVAPTPKTLMSPGAPQTAEQTPSGPPPPETEPAAADPRTADPAEASSSTPPAEDPLLARARAARQAALRQAALASKTPSDRATQPSESRAQPTRNRQPTRDRPTPARSRREDGPRDRQQSVPPAIDRGTAPLNIAWPDDDEFVAMPVEAFQIIAPEDVDGPLWPHPSTWVVPGSDWEDLENL